MWGISVDTVTSWTTLPSLLTIDVPHFVSYVDNTFVLAAAAAPLRVASSSAAASSLSQLGSFGIPPSPSDSKRDIPSLITSDSAADIPSLTLNTSSSTNDIATTAAATATATDVVPSLASPQPVTTIVADAAPVGSSESAPMSPASPSPDPRPADWAYGADEAAALKWLLSATSHAPADGWTFNHTTSTEIIVYTNDVAAAAEGARATSGIGAIMASPERVLAEVTHPSKWTKWDPLFKSFEFTDLSPVHRVYHLCFNGVFPYGARDIVYLETRTLLPDGSVVIATRGITHPAYPETSSYVRARLVAGGWHIRRAVDDPNRSLVTYLICTDPKLAMVPKWVLAMAATRLPAVIDKVRAGVKTPV